MSELTLSRPSRVPWRMLLLLLPVVAAVASLVVFPVKDWHQSTLEYIQAFQEGGSAHWGAAILAGLNILAGVLFLRVSRRVLLLLLLVAAAVALFVLFPVKDWLQSTLEYIQAFQEGVSAL